MRKSILLILFHAALRMPRVAIAVTLLLLAALAASMTYTGILVVGVVANWLGISRILAGLLLGILFARVPRIREGKLGTIGLLPKPARRPVILALLAACLLNFIYRGDMLPALFLAFAIAFALVFPRIRRSVVSRARSTLFTSKADPKQRGDGDDSVIDGEFREKKD